MRVILLILLLSVFMKVSAQITPATFWSKRCDFITDGRGKSLDLKIKIVYPCDFKEAEGNRPNVVKKFSYNLGEEGSLLQMLIIQKLPKKLSKKEIAELYTQSGLREIASDAGTFVSGRKLKIDGIDCGEVVTQLKRETPAATIYLNNILYFIVYKDKIINIGFGAGGENEIDAKNLFTKHKFLFQALATKTIILSQWE